MSGWRTILGVAPSLGHSPPEIPIPPEPLAPAQSGGSGGNGGTIRAHDSCDIHLETWDATEWKGFFDERAGIAEFNGGLARLEAEVRAWECCIAEWLIRNPIRSDPGRCHGCGESGGRQALLAYGTAENGHTWLHATCWPAWYSRRRSDAVAALLALGIAMSSW
jgi:hypothetical protein